MAEDYVAKSYQEWEKLTEPYEKDGRMYMKLLTPKGVEKEVRAYSETEYSRLYREKPCGNGAQPTAMTTVAGPVVKNVLGFKEGYIWIFRGDLENAAYWFEKTLACRFHVVFGWYIASTDEIPFDIPSCITAVQLPWEKVGNTDGTLLPKATIEAALNDLRNEGSTSQFQGAIGERLTLELYFLSCKAKFTNQFGPQYEYRFQDNTGNYYIWNSGVGKEWAVGDIVNCKASVKSHDVIHGHRTTNLTRLMEGKK